MTTGLFKSSLERLLRIWERKSALEGWIFSQQLVYRKKVYLLPRLILLWLTNQHLFYLSVSETSVSIMATSLLLSRLLYVRK